MPAALGRRHHPVDQVIPGLITQHRDLTIQHRDIDLAATPGTGTLDQCGLNADDGEHACRQVPERDAGAHGQPAVFASQAHAARQRLHDHVVGRVVPIRAILAEAGNAAPDQARILTAHFLVRQAQLLDDARPKILDHHITLLCQIPNDLAAS